MAAAYVYIMLRKQRSAYDRSTGQSAYKIGLSVAPDIRRQQVEDGVGKGVVLVRAYRFANAHRTEKKLHRIFADSRYTLRKSGRGAGKTEWFKLTGLEYLALEFQLFWMWLQPSFWVAVAVWLGLVGLGVLIN